MEYVRDINIQEAVIHVLDKNGEEPILNQYKIELCEDIYKFIYKHIEKCFKDDELKYAVFNKERSIVKELSKDYLNGIEKDLIGLSQELARQLFIIMKANANIPSCDLLIVSLITDQGPMIGIIKMDYVKSFTHKIDIVGEKVGIDIIQQSAGLPGENKKVLKAAFIKPIRKNQSYNIMLLDKQKKSKDEEYGYNYFINNFIGCSLVVNERDMTKAFIEATEKWTRLNFIEDPGAATEIRNVIKNKLVEEETIDIDDLSKEIFKSNGNTAEKFSSFIKNHNLEDKIDIDKEYVEKKLKRINFKIDRDIDLYINNEVYNDKERFEITKNSDGSINMLLKNISNYIEK